MPCEWEGSALLSPAVRINHFLPPMISVGGTDVWEITRYRNWLGPGERTKTRKKPTHVRRFDSFIHVARRPRYYAEADPLDKPQLSHGSAKSGIRTPRPDDTIACTPEQISANVLPAIDLQQLFDLSIHTPYNRNNNKKDDAWMGEAHRLQDKLHSCGKITSDFFRSLQGWALVCTDHGMFYISLSIRHGNFCDLFHMCGMQIQSSCATQIPWLTWALGNHAMDHP